MSAEGLARPGPRAKHEEGGQWAEAGRRADSARGVGSAESAAGPSAVLLDPCVSGAFATAIFPL